MTNPAQATDVQGYFCPLQSAAHVQRQIGSKIFILEDGCLEKLCKKCGDYWPLDTEFWFADKDRNDGLFNCCKACYMQMRWPDGRPSANALAKAA